MNTLKQTMILAVAFCTAQQSAIAQYTTDPADIHPFTFDGKTYEIVKENRSWADAAACAVTRGGKLAEIGSAEEQDAIFAQMNSAGIVASATVAPDGGNGSYLWLGGSDRETEGTWTWNGDNDATSSPFWIGTANGSPVAGMFTNWGFEPDDWNGQDGLGLAFTDWPLGDAGQWNDVDETNLLYFIVEYPALHVPASGTMTHTVYPNPAASAVTIATFVPGSQVTIATIAGETVLRSEQATTDLSALPAGTYLLIVTEGERTSSQLLVKQ